MSSNYKYLGIASVITIAALIIYQIRAQNSYEGEISALRKSQTAALQISQDTIAQLQRTIATLNNQLSAMQTRLANGNQNSDTGAVAAPAVTSAAPQNAGDAIRGMMDNPAIKQATNTMISKMMVNSVYGDFIRGLHLSAAEKESLTQIFYNAMTQKTDLQRQRAEGKITQAQYDAGIKDIDSNLRNSLSGYLYKEEMTAFDQYEATKDTRAASRALQTRESDLERNAPGLNADARKYVARILNDETARLRVQPVDALTALQNPGAAATALTQPLDNALQRIRSEGSLDKSQVSAVEDYVAQQKDMLDSMTQLTAPLQRK